MKQGVQLMFNGMLALDMSSRQDIQSQAYQKGYVVSNDGSIWERGRSYQKDRAALDRIAGAYMIKVIEVDIGRSSPTSQVAIEATA